jgi:hypothetical protein
MSNQFLTRRQYASHYIITPVSKTGNKKNNTKQILMIYIHFFDNDIFKERTGLKCTFTGTHRSQRNNLRMMKKVIVLLIVISVTFFLSFIPSTVMYTVGVYEYDLSYLSDKERIGVLISLHIYNISCAVNPCIHMCIDSGFRRESKRFIIRKWRRIMKC